MKFPCLLIAALLEATVYAADRSEKQSLRRTAESHSLEHQHAPKNYKPRGEKSSRKVTYFTMGGKNEKNEKKGSRHDDDNDRESRIVGGSQSSPGEFPYYVDLGGCGGSLIAPNVVLTAAHCGSYQGEEVIVGAYSRADSTANNAVRVSVSADVPHPNYDDFTIANDFRLLRLSQDVTIGGSSVVLSINNQFSRPSNGEDLTVLGLGTTSEGGNVANILRDVEIQAVSSATCNQSNGYGGDVEDDIMFCAGVNGGGKDSCQGDSGGPIVIRNGNQHVQVGVVSWGDGCAQANKPGVYARVSSAFNWIEGVVCDEWGSNADFCGGSSGGTPTPPSPTPPSPTPPSPTPPAPTPPSGGGCSSGEMEFDFTIQTDAWGWETSWEAKRSSGTKVASGSNYESDRTYGKKKCIPHGCYTLTIFDDYGDGLSDSGNYELKVNGQVIEAKSGIDFGYERSIDFGSCGSDGGSSGSGGSCSPITLNLRTDDYGYETDLFLLTDTGELVWNANGFADNKDYQFTTCLDSSECATLDIFDEWGDGISSPGFVKLTVDGTTYFNSGDIGGGIVFRIGQNC